LGVAHQQATPSVVLKVGEKTVYSMAQAGELPAFKVRGQWRFARKDIDAWIEQQKHTTQDFGEEGPEMTPASVNGVFI
jgi:excisionase family DNA binding protein